VNDSGCYERVVHLTMSMIQAVVNL